MHRHKNIQLNSAALTTNLLRHFKWEYFDQCIAWTLPKVIFMLSPNWRIFWAGAASEVTMNLKKVLVKWLNNLAANENAECIPMLVKRYDKCLTYALKTVLFNYHYKLQHVRNIIQDYQISKVKQSWVTNNKAWKHWTIINIKKSLPT